MKSTSQLSAIDDLDEKLEAITGPDDFAACVGTKFRLPAADGGGAELELVSARSLGPNAPRYNERREPFTLLFRAPSPQFYLPQSIYRLEHKLLGALEIFLVPIGPDDRGMRFEAIFN